MNPEPIIQLDNVSVRYRAPQERIGTFKEYAIRWMQGKVKQQTFLALDDVSLEVRRGEVFGLIGKNGAGKSTLLKMVARVLRPTVGRVRVTGRVAPLLEMGAGFHPELTGRENIYLNGAMLGFTRAEMDEKYPRIVEFAELGDFIEAPIRTYSSGMWARLGFAVATDTRPEILIVDEILSVGDEAFQRKSYERIQSFREQGATILFVSHNMALVESMCQRAAWLDGGKLAAVGAAKSVVDRYLGRVREDEAGRLIQSSIGVDQRWGNRMVEIVDVHILDQQGTEAGVFFTGQPLMIEIEYIAHQPVQSPIFGMALHRQDGTHITGPNTAFAGVDLGLIEGHGKIRYTIPSLPLLESLYHVSVAATNAADTEMYDYHDRAYHFRVLNRGSDVREKYGLLTMGGIWQKM
jgi:ABC-type polysaccharide/polyol phosphate transport system ATPase subunit